MFVVYKAIIKTKKVSPHFLQLGAMKLQNVKFTRSKLRWANTEI